MRWMTHQVAGVGAVLMLDGPLLSLGGVIIGSTLPDVLDKTIASFSTNPQAAFNKIHRGTTHWFGWWVLAYFLALSNVTPMPIRPFVFGLALGGLVHVIFDAITPMGVPLLPWSRKGRISLNLVSTGGVMEYVLLVSMCVFLYMVKGEQFLSAIRGIVRKFL